MLLQAEAGTEQWVKWAKAQLARLSAIRQITGLFTQVKTYIPQDGVTVWIRSSEAGDAIRITGGGGFRAWNGALSAHAPLGSPTPGADAQEAFTPANWSNDRSTFARLSGADTILRRKDGTETTIADTYTPPDFGAGTFYHNTAAYLSATGTAVTLPATPTLEKVATVTKWDKDDGWISTDVPFPPEAAAAGGFANAGLAAAVLSNGYYSTPSTNKIVLTLYPPVLGGLDITYNPPSDAMFKVMADPYRMDAVYCDVRYWALEIDSLVQQAGIGPINGDGTAPAYVSSALLTSTPVQQVWKYTIATGVWSLAYTYEGDDGKRSANFYGACFDLTIPQFRGPIVGETTENANVTHWQPYFAPQDGLHVVSADTLTEDPPTETTFSFTAGGFTSTMSFTVPLTGQNPVYSTPCTLLMDGADAMTGVAISTVQHTFQTLSNSAVSVSQVASVDGAPRLALGTRQWRWGPEVADQLTLPVGTPLYSPKMKYAFMPTKVYREGELIFDVTLDGGAGARIYRASFKHEGSFLCSYSAAGEVGEPVIGYGGAVSIPSLGLVLPVNLASGLYFDSTGTTLNPGGLTVAAANAALGVTDTAFILDGTTYEIAVAPPATDHFAIAKIREPEDGDATIQTVTEIPQVIGVEGPGEVTFDKDKIVPDECLPARAARARVIS